MKEPIKLNSLAGGVDIDAAVGKDVNIFGGQITISSKTDEISGAFSVTTNQGSSETIVLQNTQEY